MIQSRPWSPPDEDILNSGGIKWLYAIVIMERR